MDTTTRWFVGLQIVTNVFLLMTFLVYFLQWRTMRGQLEATQEQLRITQGEASAQNLFSLINYLQEPESRDARAWVLQRLPGKDVETWEEDDRNYASRVCSKYDVVGLLVRDGIVPKGPVLSSWGPSIRKCHETLEPFIRTMQAKHGGSYWDDFDWIYAEARKLTTLQ
jgi:hypothetical protein